MLRSAARGALVQARNRTSITIIWQEMEILSMVLSPLGT
jgi:hypothetical protein